VGDDDFEWQIDDQDELVAAVTSAAVADDEIETHVRNEIDRIAAWVARRTQTVGPPFARLGVESGGTVEVTVGWPIADDVEGDDTVSVERRPAARALVNVHAGSYDDLRSHLPRVGALVEAEGLAVEPHFELHFITDSDRHDDPSTWQTRVVWPLT